MDEQEVLFLSQIIRKHVRDRAEVEQALETLERIRKQLKFKDLDTAVKSVTSQKPKPEPQPEPAAAEPTPDVPAEEEPVVEAEE